MKKFYWPLLLLLLAGIVIISGLFSGECTDGCGDVGITGKCQIDDECKYIINPPIPGEAGCYNLIVQGNYLVNNSIQCECINDMCILKA